MKAERNSESDYLGFASSAESALRRLGRTRENAAIVVGGLIMLSFLTIAVIVVISSALNYNVTPYNPIEQSVGPSLAPPSFAHLFGTDLEGRDVFSRVIAAIPNDLFVGLVVVSFALFVGMLVGSFAGLKGGLFDEALMRSTDIFFALPSLILAMAVGIVLGPGLVNMTLALTIIWWPPYARLARGEALKVAHQNYIESARTSGFGSARIVFSHVLPNIFSTMVVYATIDMGVVILVYSGLSYLGLSVTPPAPDLGQMVAGYQDYILRAPWLPIFPGLAIALGVIGLSILGDGLRDLLAVA